MIKYLLAQWNVRKHQNNVYQKRIELLIVDSYLSTLFAMYKRILKNKWSYAGPKSKLHPCTENSSMAR